MIDNKLKIALEKVKELQELGLKASIGGSLALYLHGIIDREPNDIDIVIDVNGQKHRLIEDIEFIGYQNCAFLFKIPVRTLSSDLNTIIETLEEQVFNSTFEVIKEVVKFKIGIPDFPDYDSEYIGHDHEEGIKIDYLVTDKAISNTYLYNGVEVPLNSIETIMEARLRYGKVHKRFAETLEIMSKPLDSKLQKSPPELPF